MTESSGHVRGYVVLGFLDYVEKNLPDPDQLLARHAQEVVAALPLERSTLYPAEYFSMTLDAVVASSEEPAERFERARRGGMLVAEDSINTFFRLLMKVLTASLFAKKLPTMWPRDFGVGTVDATADVDARQVRVEMTGMEPLRNFVPVGCGYMQVAFEAMGYRGVRVRALEPGQDVLTADRIVYEIQWQ